MDNFIVDKDLKDLTVLSLDGAVLSSAYSWASITTSTWDEPRWAT